MGSSAASGHRADVQRHLHVVVVLEALDPGQLEEHEEGPLGDAARAVSLEHEQVAIVDIDVKGKVTGDITSRSVNVHTSGRVQGSIKADAVTIQGVHTGSIECNELALEKNAEVKSDVKAQTLSSEKGARLVGKVQITG